DLARLGSPGSLGALPPAGGGGVGHHKSQEADSARSAVLCALCASAVNSVHSGRYERTRSPAISRSLNRTGLSSPRAYIAAWSLNHGASGRLLAPYARMDRARGPSFPNSTASTQPSPPATSYFPSPLGRTPSTRKQP